MPSLTDEQIVRRIAKFMGWMGVRQEEPYEGATSYPGAWLGVQLPSVGLMRLPDWLTSYDAVATVLSEIKRLTAFSGPLGRARYDQLLTFWADIEFFEQSPREHAEAIAVALGGEE